MLPTSHLVAFIVTAFVVIAIPGPSVLFTVGRALTIGRRGALLTVVGNSIGVYLQAILVAIGLGAIVERSVAAYTVLKLAGAAYLIYLGVQAIRHRRRAAAAIDVVVSPQSSWRVLREGVIVGVTNPKMIIFLTAAMPQFIEPAKGHVPAQILTLGLIMVMIALLTDSIWAFVAGTARTWFARSPRRIQVMSGTGGAAMIGLGASFVLLGHKD
jgi:threonine/homoserine/homoserine lactone efflux protein